MASLSEAPLRRVFLGNSIDQLSAQIIEQAKQVLREAGVELSTRAAPIILMLMKHGPMTAADVAKALNQAHQLVTHHVDALVSLEIVTRVSDPGDARRKLLKVTPKGHVQLVKLKEILDLIEVVYEDIFGKLGCDLAAKVLEASGELSRSPLAERIAAVQLARADSS